MPKTGYFVLHANVKPKVTAGSYDLVSEQTGLPFDVATEHTHIKVSSPRYSMPTDQILSTFPPANAEGAFGDRLPQIVLKRRTLPWERNPEEKSQVSDTPWLALVVVAEGEAQLSTATPVAQCLTPADGVPLLEPSDQDVAQGLYLAVTQTVVNKIFPTIEDLPLLTHVREVDINDTELANGDDDGWLAVVLANRLPVFDKANGKPVRYMACLVSVEAQLPHLAKPQAAVDEFSFELAQDWRVLAEIDPKIGIDPRVMGGVDLGGLALPAQGLQQHGAHATRSKAAKAAKMAQAAQQLGAGALPRAGGGLDGAAAMKEAPYANQWKQVTQQVNAAALDPNAKVLVRDTMAAGFRLPIEVFALEPVYRFPVLAHWSFTTTEGATFETLMQGLDVGLLGTLPEPDPNTPPAARPLPEVVETGHVGLDHRTRRGDAARAWYRGPMVPFPMLRDGDSNQPLLAHASDQLRRVVPDGREDLALAAAFEIGRLLALSQLSVVSALLRFRNEQFGIGRLRETLSRVIPYKLPELVDTRIDFGRFVAMQFIGDLVVNPETMLGPRRPVADPGRELKVDGDLNAVIAAGFGFDLAAVTKLADQVGVLGAVARTPVSVAQATEGLTPALVADLHATLDASLAKVLDVAIPQQKLQVPKGARVAKGARPARAGHDALDELIGRGEARHDDEEAKGS